MIKEDSTNHNNSNKNKCCEEDLGGGVLHQQYKGKCHPNYFVYPDGFKICYTSLDWLINLKDTGKKEDKK